MDPAAVFHNPVNYNALPGAIPPQYQITELRKIRVELSQIEEELKSHLQEDLLSEETREWLGLFTGALDLAVLHNLDIKPVIARFTALLKSIVEHAEDSPLTRLMRRFLGEPCEQIIAPPEVDLLQQPEVDLLQQEVNDLGLDVLEMLGAMRARRELHEIRVEAQQPLLDRFEQDLRNRVNEVKDRYLAEMAEVGREQQENFRNVEAQIRAVAVEHRPAVDQIKANLAKLQDENQNIKNDTAALKQRLAEGYRHISELEKIQINLQIKLNDLNQKINEREQERNQGLLVTLAIVAACIVIDFMLPGAGRAANAAAAGAGTATGTAAGASAGAGAAAAAAPAATTGFRMGLEPVSNGAMLRFGWGF